MVSGLLKTPAESNSYETGLCFNFVGIPLLFLLVFPLNQESKLKLEF